MSARRKDAKGSVRIGPISLFSLIILLSLAVLSVLAFTTAQATFASAEKHARFTTDTYANETQAQELVSQVDTVLAGVRAVGGTKDDALAALAGALPTGATLDGDTVTAQFSQDSGRMLSIALQITDDAGYRITQWQATTRWDVTKQPDVLWSGGTN
ncbi:MAG: S4A5 electrogenic sodium bicarbonate cotransporter 4 [Eggerthellaceae bacterium]|nr:S4A5 electrogenic sodium bicarbonate cotransporter 4 [Eggerthellaceae bacterium]